MVPQTIPQHSFIYLFTYLLTYLVRQGLTVHPWLTGIHYVHQLALNSQPPTCWFCIPNARYRTPCPAIFIFLCLLTSRQVFTQPQLTSISPKMILNWDSTVSPSAVPEWRACATVLGLRGGADGLTACGQASTLQSIGRLQCRGE